MADNAFDQFDSTSNAFDQFDATKAPEVQQPSLAHQIMRGLAIGGIGLYKGAANLATLPIDAGINLYNAASGSHISTTAQDREAALAQIGPQNLSPGEQFASAVNQGVGGAALSLGAGAVLNGAASPILSGVGGSMITQPTTQLVSGATGAGSSDIARQMGAPAWGQAAAGIAGGALPVIGSAIAQRMGPNPNVPGSDMLRSVANDKYQKVADSNLSVSQQDFQGLAGKMGDTFKQFGLTSTQDVKDLYPKLGKVVGRIEGAIDSGADVPLNDLMNLRKLIKLGASSPDRSERALSMGLTENLDDLVSGATSIPEGARDLWRRSSNAEMIDRMAQKAEDSTSQFGASGYENAVRTQFRQFVKNDSKMRLLNPSEQDAMRQVSNGTLTGNLMRAMGRFAPRGPVSVGADYFLGGGPLGAVLTAGAGEAGRVGATVATAQNMQLARDVMLTGGAAVARPPIQWPLYGGLAGIYGSQQ